MGNRVPFGPSTCSAPWSEGREAGHFDIDVSDVDVARHFWEVDVLDGGDSPRRRCREAPLKQTQLCFEDFLHQLWR